MYAAVSLAIDVLRSPVSARWAASEVSFEVASSRFWPIWSCAIQRAAPTTASSSSNESTLDFCRYFPAWARAASAAGAARNW